MFRVSPRQYSARHARLEAARPHLSLRALHTFIWLDPGLRWLPSHRWRLEPSAMLGLAACANAMYEIHLPLHLGMLGYGDLNGALRNKKDLGPSHVLLSLPKHQHQAEALDSSHYLPHQFYRVLAQSSRW
jgi:hypothetical protein